MQFSEQVFIHLLLCQDIVLGAGDAGGWFIVSVLSGSQVSGHHPHHQGFHCGRSTFPPPLLASQHLLSSRQFYEQLYMAFYFIHLNVVLGEIAASL